MGANTHPGQKGREINAHQLQTALVYTGRTQYAKGRFAVIENMGKGKHISMETLTEICEILDCDISDVIQLEHEEKCTDSTGNKLNL